MKKSIVRIIMFGLVAAVIAITPTQGFAQEKKKKDSSENKEEPKGGKKKRDGLPAGGKLGAVDKKAKTITVADKTYHVTADTRITKAGKPATLDDGVVGEDVGIYYKKGDDDKMTALSVRFGPRPDGGGKDGEKKEKKKKKED